MQKAYFIIIALIGVLLLAGVAFLILHKTNSPSSVLSVSSNNQNAPNQSFRGRGFRNLPAGSKPIFGLVTTINSDKVTLSGRMGDLTIVINANTKFTSGSQSDIKVNDRLVGYGTTNSDGTVIAQQLTLNPTFGGRRMFNGGTSDPNNSPGI